MKRKNKIWDFETYQEAMKNDPSAILKLSPQEKCGIITMLREQVWGREATTGKVERVFELVYRP